jgi:hypothetical protein
MTELKETKTRNWLEVELEDDMDEVIEAATPLVRRYIFL